MKTLHLVHWNQEQGEALAEPMRQSGWDVRLESKDGERAYKQIAEDPPDALVISLARKPSHGRQTALAVRQRIALETLPIFFVDGDQPQIELVREQLPEEQYVTNEELMSALAKIKDQD